MAAALVAEIVTTGTEILLGDIVDTNAAWIAQQLREAGVNLYYKTTVGDNEPRVRGVIEQSMQRCDAIIVTGGLGPTVDDITRQAIANATGRRLVLNEAALATLKLRFERFGAQMTENNLQQVYIPEDALVIENPVGTAPGFIVETERCAVIALPGVPREMKELMTASVLPYLRQRAGQSGIIRRRILRTFGIGESIIDHLLDDLMRASNPTMGLAAHTGQCDVRIAARAETAEAAEALLDQAEAQVRAQIGRYIYSTTPGEAYETVLARRLQEAGITVALLETNTRGDVARRLANALEGYNPVLMQVAVDVEELPQALEGLVSALISDSDKALYSSAHGRGDAALALAAAAAVALRERSGAAVAVALAGTSGADEGLYAERSGETALAVATPSGVIREHIDVGGSDDYTIVRIGNQALRALWQLTL